MPTFSGSLNPVFRDGRENSDKYGDIKDQVYVTIDEDRCARPLVLNPAGTFIATHPIPYHKAMRVPEGQLYWQKDGGFFASHVLHSGVSGIVA